MVKRFLVTTALEETWRDDAPVLFLGEWCRRYSRQDRWSKMNAEVLPFHWDDRAKLYSDYQYLSEFYERLLVDLSTQLNEIQRVDRSLRYWRILIGPWLGYFVQMLFERWTSIHLANSQYDLSDTIVLAGREELLVPHDMASFEKLVFGDEWNHHLCGTILKQYTKVPCVEVLRKDREEEAKSIPATTWKKSAKNTLVSCCAQLFSLLARNQDAFFLSTYLKFSDEIIWLFHICSRRDISITLIGLTHSWSKIILTW
jgi:putative transferase (TIGR04331 family)